MSDEKLQVAQGGKTQHVYSFVESIPKLARFNDMPIMREYLNNAHLINQPMLGDTVLPPEEFLATYIP